MSPNCLTMKHSSHYLIKQCFDVRITRTTKLLYCCKLYAMNPTATLVHLALMNYARLIITTVFSSDYNKYCKDI